MINEKNRLEQLERFQQLLADIKRQVENTKGQFPEVSTSKAYPEIEKQVINIDTAITELKDRINEKVTDEIYNAYVRTVNSSVNALSLFVRVKRENPPGFMGMGQRSIGATVLYKSIGENIFEQPVLESPAILKTIPKPLTHATKQPIDEGEVQVTIHSSESTPTTPEASPKMGQSNIAARESFSANHLRFSNQANALAGENVDMPPKLRQASKQYLAATNAHQKLNPTDPQWEASATAVMNAHQTLKAEANKLRTESPINMALSVTAKRLDDLAKQVLPDTQHRPGNKPE